MFRVHVFIEVKESDVEAFKAASIDNAFNSRKEIGVKGFDVIQEQDCPTHFVLEETYVSLEAQQSHRETEHFKKWKSTITSMLAHEYTFKKFNVIEKEA
ncbi:quinol monooxygenase YgiN [Ruminiclostridium sufflavum DSM 19573]|uniref:Quinol monooxygenase YgiN n=1 Tax=Ruminiclostridium sufflavum DSM 19573 TaxID=1121337 RepID=A0A318XG98_9FIRM|nr:antibiotic biosynthesis monooxygenase [Ruminiclostridium sufflavum]PYG84957.1 quinol monooxygenase YgiN [Ruminiclostridium sufflavum DSM 19573]